jgi:site-specific DNA recombinase
VRSYPDDGYSGYSGKRRPGFEQLIIDVEDSLLDVVVFWKIDRLTRNHKDFQRLWEACQAQGARIVSVTEDFDSSTPMGEFVMRLLVGMAKMASDDTSLRVKSYIAFAKRAAEREGRPWRWGRRPFGWAPDGVTPLEAGGQLTWTVKRKPPAGGPRVEEEVTFQPEADYLREGAQHMVSGGSLRAIQTHWAAAGIRTTTGHPWDTASLRKVFLAPRNEVILDPATSALVRAVLTDPARRTNRGSARVHLLSGELDCGGCENQLKPHVSRRVAPEYVCHSGIDSNGRRGCGRVCRSTEAIDELVKGDLLYRLGSWHVESALAGATADDGQHELLAERQALQARYDQLAERLADRRANPEIDIEDDAEAVGLVRAMDKLKLRLLEIDRLLARDRQQLQRSRSPLLDEALQHPERLEAAWESYTVQQRHDLLKAAGFVRGRLSPGKPRARHLDPFTFERSWRKRNGEVESISGPSPGSQAQPPKTRADLAAEQQGRYICQCGCGQPIVLRPHHFNTGASVPRIVRGHNPGGWSTRRRSSKS